MIVFRWVKGVIATPFTLVWTFLWCSVSVAGAFLGGKDAWGNFVLKNWGGGILKAFNVNVEVLGLENLPKEGVIFVFNHTSFLDIPVFYKAIPKTTRFGAKYELFKVPIFGATLRAFGMLPIVRHQRDKVFELYNRSIEKVKEGKSFVLAAEGTRQHNDGVGDTFKSGPFIFAINGGFKVCPVVMKGCAAILPKTSYLAGVSQWGYKVQVEILPPTDATAYTTENRKELMNKVQIEMKDSFARLN